MRNKFNALLFFLISNISYSQSTISFTDELKGMSFNAKIDFKPDCKHTTPFIRATLHSVEVTSFEYEGKYYSGKSIEGVAFPIKVKGYLDVSTLIAIGYYPNNHSYELNKTSLSTELGGNGNEFFAEEFRFAEGEVSKLLRDLEVRSCIDLKNNKAYINPDFLKHVIRIHGGDLRYNDQSLNLYLKNKIGNQIKLESDFDDLMSKTNNYRDLYGEYELSELDSILNKLNSFKKKELTNSQLDDLTEQINRIEAVKKRKQEEKELATERKFETLSPYTKCSSTSNKNSIEFYKQGIKKVEELIKTSKTREDKNKLNIILKNINNCLSQRIKIQITKDKLNAELKRDRNKSKIGKIRYSKEELARINQQIAYTNKVKSFTSKGINSIQAHKMAQDEFKIQVIDNVVGTGLNQISDIIMNSINRASARRESEYEKNRQTRSNYKSWINNYKSQIYKVNRNRRDQISKLPIFKYNSENVYDLKQEILGLISFENNTKKTMHYSARQRHIISGMAVYRDLVNATIIIDRTIEDAYFENNMLIIQTKEVCKEAGYDKNHLKNYGTKMGYKPAKFILNTLIKYNLDTEENSMYHNISWVGYRGIPGNYTYISQKDLLSRLNRLIKSQVVIPSKGYLLRSNILDWTITSKLRKIKGIKNNITLKKIKNLEKKNTDPNKTGRFKIQDNDGYLRGIEEWRNGELIKTWNNFNEYGYLPIGKYRNGKKHGEWKTYYSYNGSIIKTGNWENGNKIGVWKAYNGNGQLSSTTNWKNNLEEGEFISYRNGKISIVGNFSRGEKTGIWKEYDHHGQLSSTTNWKNNLKEGEYISYANGKKIVVGNFSRGEKTGIWKEYDRHGQLSSTTNWKNNSKEGNSISYYFKNGKRNKKVGNYTKNEKTGVWKYYSEEGKLKSLVYYENNQFKYYCTGKFVKGKKHGEWKFYDKQKKLVKTENYLKGVKQ